MSDVVIKVENLSKKYRLGTVGTGTLSHDLNRLWAKLRGKEDPYKKIGETNDRTKKSASEYVWALKDINFEVKRGEVLGIIGRNGAGKSTLLKILSQITKPTTGTVKMKGRVGSLLEVGTGFHPDLTGRENIYINGAILGMRRWEIDKRLDEIIDFAGVEKYIDTPVKRYSSGMMVRLGFAVAAHLDPEILIVDEVLAVGDMDFQKRCLGRMEKISKEDGRTILLVSHNMDSLLKFSNSSLFLTNGQLNRIGSTESIVNDYLGTNSINHSYSRMKSSSSVAYFNWIKLDTNNYEVTFEANIDEPIKAVFSLEICNSRGIVIYTIRDIDSDLVPYSKKNGLYLVKTRLKIQDLMPGSYYLNCAIVELGVQRFEKLEKAIIFEILSSTDLPEISTREGCLKISSEWEFTHHT